MEAILRLNGVYGGYFARKPVLRDISFTVGRGEMIGLIGLNGAGKSTTIKHILGLLKPQQGEIRITGRKLEDDPQAYRSSFAYVPESPELYEELSVRDHMRMTAMAYGIGSDVYERRSEELLRLFRMEAKADTLPRFLSKGMRQKAMIMCAFLVEPALYVIDEPFLGLDPLGIRSLLELMVEEKRKGASFLISSHILSTIESYCDGFVVLHHGDIVASGTLSDMNRTAGLQNASLDDLFYALVQGEER